MSSIGHNHRCRPWIPLLFVLGVVPPTSGDPGQYPYGACCHWPSGACEAAVRIAPNLYCCNGSCQTTEFPGACAGNESCYIGGDCDVMDGYCCYYFGGDGISGDDCNGNEIHDNCDLEGNDCQPNGQPDECDADCNGNDTPDDCEARQACCKANGSCQYLPADCCAGVGGVPAGPGTSCSGNPDLVCGYSYACCTDTPGSYPYYCQNWNLHYCVTVANGTPQLQTNCKSLNQSADGDSIPDACDNCDNHNNFTQIDNDNDDVGDVCDNCNPSNPTHHCNATGFTCYNPTQQDGDNDTVGNACDNCVSVSNANQANCDGDLLGNGCDNDIDGDGVTNLYDVCDYTPAGVTVINIVNHKLRGTIHGDVDGDCDRDQSDLNAMPVTGPACPGGTFDANCPMGGGGSQN